jgi:hypothetical protein
MFGTFEIDSVRYEKFAAGLARRCRDEQEVAKTGRCAARFRT